MANGTWWLCTGGFTAPRPFLHRHCTESHPLPSMPAPNRVLISHMHPSGAPHLQPTTEHKRRVPNLADMFPDTPRTASSCMQASVLFLLLFQLLRPGLWCSLKNPSACLVSSQSENLFCCLRVFLLIKLGYPASCHPPWQFISITSLWLYTQRVLPSCRISSPVSESTST